MGKKSQLRIGTSTITEITDPDTGEIVTNVKHHKFMTKDKDTFLLVYSSLIANFLDMSMPQIRVYGYLLRFANGVSFSIDKSLRLEMSSVLGLNERTIYNTLKELENNQLIFKINGTYRLNPRYAFQGSTADRSNALKVIIELGCKGC